MKLEEIVKYQNDLLRILAVSMTTRMRSMAYNWRTRARSTKWPRQWMLAKRFFAWPSRRVRTCLIVHHGLFWGGLQTGNRSALSQAETGDSRMTWPFTARICHWMRILDIGNNALLCNALDLPEPRQAISEDRITSETALDRRSFASVSSKRLAAGASCPGRTTGYAQNRSGHRRRRWRNLQSSCGGRRHLHHRGGAPLVVYGCRGTPR